MTPCAPQASARQLLVERNGTVTNLGGNYFALTFAEPPRGYPVEPPTAADEYGGSRLLSAEPLEERAGFGGFGGFTATELTLHTTYLSELMWVIRDESGENFAVFSRTDTRAVIDRRGLVAAGQLKPSDDETIRCALAIRGATWCEICVGRAMT